MSADPHAPAHDLAHDHGPNLKLYLSVAVILCIVTLTSFVMNWLQRNENVTVMTSFAVILLGACVKATLVALYFMHLKFDWRTLYFMIIPCLILATMMMFVLLPDIVLAWHHHP
jgi:cytochrome c oxidase subunit 4